MAKAAKAAPAQVAEKRPPWRPSSYRPEFCERVIELGRMGYSPAQIADDLDVLRETLYDWAGVHPDFSTAFTRAKVAAQAYWERKGHDGMSADKFNALVWKTSMQARFRDDYTEKRINEHTGPDGGPIKHEATTVDASALSADERAALRAVMLMAKGKAG